MEPLKLKGRPFVETKINEKSNGHYDLSTIIIPFSKIFKGKKQSDIYSGTERIPFKERDPEYKMILRQEFANTLKVEFKIFKPVVKFPSF
ncbi:MAG: hypothetical protein ACFFBV_09150 [Promethearchaeota archaeon]